MSSLTQERVRELFNYDPETGILSNRIARGSSGRVGFSANSPGSHGYLQVTVDGEVHLVHRVIFLWMTGKWPVCKVDHDDTNKLNNRWRNLREATDTESVQNRRAHSNNLSGFKGVSYHKRDGKFFARITVNKKHIHLGYFKTPEEAAAAYSAAATKHFGQYARS